MKRRRFLDLTCKGLLSGAGLASASSSGLGLESSSVAAGQAPAAPTTLFLGGDVMLARGVDQVLPHPGSLEIYEASEHTAESYVALAEKANGPIPRGARFDYIWGDAVQELEATAPAVRLVNLETSITTSSDAWPDKGIHYRMNPANTPVLEAAGIDGCCLANNHVLDYGYSGMTQTLQSLRKAGIAYAGAGQDEAQAAAPAIFAAGRGRVLLFAAAMGDSGVPPEWAAGPGQPGVNRIGPSAESVRLLAAQVHAAKRTGDIAVLSLHWGGNWGYRVEQAHREFAHRVIDEAGIDLIHGHSSHHPRGIEIWRNKAIIYGCGDLINDYEGITPRHPALRSDLVLMYFPTLNPASGEVLRFELAPMRIRKIQLQRATPQEAEWLATILDSKSAKGTHAALKANGRIEVTWQDTGSAG